jgi:hypothetical protein
LSFDAWLSVFIIKLMAWNDPPSPFTIFLLIVNLLFRRIPLPLKQFDPYKGLTFPPLRFQPIGHGSGATTAQLQGKADPRDHRQMKTLRDAAPHRGRDGQLELKNQRETAS